MVGSQQAGLAVSYLVSLQNTNGSWSLEKNDPGIYVTAQALIALQYYQYRYVLDNVLNQANTWILDQQNLNGAIGNIFETALAVVAVAPINFDKTVYANVITYLQSVQQTDGSWDGDVYSTALATRALYIAETSTPVNPNLGTVVGQVRDGLTGNPLAGATVTVVGVETRSAVTDVEGRYVIGQLSPGNINVTTNLVGYLNANATGIITAGSVLNFNPNLSRNLTPVSLSLTGTVIDAVNLNSLTGATVRVIGSPLNTSTDANGRFTLSDIPAGSVTVEVVLPGYAPTLYAVSAPSGGVLDLGKIRLVSGPNGTTGTIVGSITDAQTGSPLRGVEVSISGTANQVAYTNEVGNFDITGVQPGNVTISAALSGYRTAIGSANIVAGTTLNFTVALVKETAPALVTVKGIVVDSVTLVPLVGASVQVAGSGLNALTGNDGAFQITGIPAGSLNVQISQTGYVNVAYSIIALNGGLVDLGTIALAVDSPVSSNPVITSTAPTQAIAGQVYAYNVQATNVESSPLIYSLSTRPTGMTINASGQISWIPTTEQVGSVSFTVVVADSQGGRAEENVSVLVSAGDNGSYVITDVETLSGLVIDDVVPSNYTLATYVSGAAPGVVLTSPSCPLSVSREVGDVADAADALDRRGLLLMPSNDSVMDLVTPHASVTVFPQIDNPLLPHEGIEYTVWGSNDPAAPFPDGWKLATLVSIYKQGWENNPSCNEVETDDYAGLYTFGLDSYQYVRVRANNSISIFDTPEHTTWSGIGDDAGEPGWQSLDAEIDAVGGMTCDIKPIANAGSDIIGLINDTIQFDGSASSGNIRLYGWDIDGDNEIDLTGPTPSNVFTSGVDQDVTLMVVDDRGCVGTDTVNLFVDLNLPKPDIIVAAVNTSSVVTNLQTLQVTGNVMVTIGNVGRAVALQPALVTVFEDSNLNGVFDLGTDVALGSLTMPNGLERNRQLMMDIPINGTVAFRDNHIYAMVDSDQRIDEEAEDNNADSTAGACRIDPPPVGDLTLAQKWRWSGASVDVSARSALGPAVVGQLTDDNGDGVIDQNDTPDLVFSSFGGTSGVVLNAISGLDGTEIWSLGGADVTALGSAALADIDSDGIVEIIISNGRRTLLRAFEHTGQLKWAVPTGPTHSNTTRDGISIADLDHDGSPEIIHGRRVFNADGSLRWRGSRDYGGERNYGALPIAADVDLAGGMEVVAGRTLYGSNGNVVWHRGDIASDGFNAVGNFDEDDFAEIVLVSRGRVYVLEHTGQTKWGPVSLPGGGRGGAPIVGDFDGDGEPEIGIAGASRYTVFETNGSVKWSAPIRDRSSRTGSSLFDFEADGRVEVLYADEVNFYIYDGETGATRVNIRNGSGTTLEYPLVADIDSDGNAEIIVAGGGGLRAFESAGIGWAPTRKIWNQHTYHINNISDDGTIPQFEQPSWLSHNTYRLNTFADRDALNTPDLSVARLQVIDNGVGAAASISVLLGNAGASPLFSPTSVAFYEGDPASGGVLLGTVSVNNVPPGQSREVVLDNVTSLTGTADIYVIADADNRIVECNEANNHIMLPVLAQTNAGNIQVGSNAPIYSPNALAELQAAVTNTSALPGEFETVLQVENAAGEIVIRFAPKRVGPLAGGAVVNVSETWDTNATIAGNYQVHGFLYSLEGVLVDESTSPIEIRHLDTAGPSLLLRTTTDKPVYNTSDLVQIDNLVRNLTVSTHITSASLRVTVQNSNNELVNESITPLNQFVPGSLRELPSSYVLNAAIEGGYTVTAEVYDDANNVLVTSSAQFNVKEDLNLSLTGEVTAQAPRVYQGEIQICTDVVRNQGTLAVTELPIRRLLVDLNNATELSSIEGVVNLGAGINENLIRSIETTDLAIGAYSCVLQAQIAGQWKTLSNASFQVDEPPIVIDTTFVQEERGRLLVLLDQPEHKESEDDDDDKHDDDSEHDNESDDSKHDDKDDDSKHEDDPHGTKLAANLVAQRAYLEDLLTREGWSYTITTDEDEFTRELRTGGYNHYALFSEQVKLDEQVQKELREAVFRGGNLLIAGDHDSRNNKLQTILGLKREGRLQVPSTISVEPVEDYLAGTLSYSLTERVSRIELRGAEVIASYPGVTACSNDDDDDHENVESSKGDDDEDHENDKSSKHDDDDDHESNKSSKDDDDDDHGEQSEHKDCITPAIAVAHNNYGFGHSVYAGFDLLAQAATVDSDPLFGQLLTDMFSDTRTDISTVRTGDVITIRLELVNQGIATPGQAVISLPAGSQVVDSGTAITQADGSLLWAFNLAEEATASLTFWLRLSDQAGLANIEALLQTGIVPTLVDYDSVLLSLTVSQNPGIQDVVDELAPLQSQHKAYRKAHEKLLKALEYQAKGRDDKALYNALKAAGYLEELDGQQADAIRRQLAFAIRELERQLLETESHK